MRIVSRLRRRPQRLEWVRCWCYSFTILFRFEAGWSTEQSNTAYISERRKGIEEGGYGRRERWVRQTARVAAAMIWLERIESVGIDRYQSIDR